MKRYRHLSLEERERYVVLKARGFSNRAIGKILHRHHTTLSRERHRNAPYGMEYLPCKAQRRSLRRSRRQHRQARLKNPEIFLYVREHLRDDGWSPGIIAGRLRIDHPDQSIHPETVYRYIYRKDNRREHLEQYLTLKRKRRMKLGERRPKRLSRIAHAVSIDERPAEVESRLHAGHWETDLMIGVQRSALALHVSLERRSRRVALKKMLDRTARSNKIALEECLKQYSVQTITSDNGLENTCHEEVAQELDARWYFCHPYHSWEKGSVENRIGVIRRYIPKGVSLSRFSDRQIAKIQNAINNRPMKCLGYLKPAEILGKESPMV